MCRTTLTQIRVWRNRKWRHPCKHCSPLPPTVGLGSQTGQARCVGCSVMLLRRQQVYFIIHHRTLLPWCNSSQC
ncbi:hypothetical protein NY78_1659 [Desulfovibrio sp. TomC]|nr:hypothetical protein NY78_1659 [Desulfovibrio sp. TomC]